MTREYLPPAGRILLIDDNRAIHGDFRKILERTDQSRSSLEAARAAFFGEPRSERTDQVFSLDSAYQGEEGVRMLRLSLEQGAPYAMAFIDMRMPPGIDGIETAKRLWESYPELQVVICTAYSDYSWEEMIGQLGNSDRLLILKKPFEAIEVLQLAHALTRKWALGQALTGRLADLEKMVGERTRELAAINEQLRAEIAERIGAEARIREQALLLDIAQDAILVSDLDDAVRYWNASAERLYGWSAAEALGRDIKELLLKDSTAFMGARRTVLEKGTWTGELLYQCKAGRELAIEGHWTLVCDEEGKPKSILSISTDITESKSLKVQLLMAHRMESLGVLAGGMAHDLNNTLAPITLAMDLLKLRFGDAESRELFEITGSCARRAADMVQQVLLFARGVVGERLALNPNEFIEEVRKIVADTFPRNLELKTAIAPNLWQVLGDATQLHQVVLNLCVNARDAMPDGGRLVLRAVNIHLDESIVAMNHEAKPGPYLLIEVQDSGMGIPAAILGRIFDPFFTTKEVGKGTGLGLSTSLGTIKNHGGFIRVVSEPGKGTGFQVYVPAHGPLEVAPAPEPPGRGRLGGNGLCVLIVDDEQMIREVMTRAVEAYGYRVLTASNGAEAVALYARHMAEITVVFIDMTMPVMDGPTAIAAIQKMAPKAKIILTSGVKASDATTRALSGVGHRFLPKPYTVKTLMEVLADVIES